MRIFDAESDPTPNKRQAVPTPVGLISTEWLHYSYDLQPLRLSYLDAWLLGFLDGCDCKQPDGDG